MSEDFGHCDCLVPISPHKLTKMENRLQGFDGEDDESNPVLWTIMAYPTPQAFMKLESFLRSLSSLQKVNSKLLSFCELGNHFHKDSCVEWQEALTVLKSVSMRKPARTRQGVIMLKSPILLKLGTNAW